MAKVNNLKEGDTKNNQSKPLTDIEKDKVAPPPPAIIKGENENIGKLQETEKTDIKKEQERTRRNKANLLKALEDSLGIVAPACNAIGLHRSTFYDWYNSDLEFKTKVDELQELALDFAENSLMRQIKDDNTAATIFFLKTKGKKRGYVETTINLNANRDLENMTDEELLSIIKS